MVVTQTRRSYRGQSTAEYAIVIGLVIAAIVAMQVYVRRGWNARAKAVVDDVGWGLKGSTGQGKLATLTSQYEPYYQESLHTTHQDTEMVRKVGEGFVVSKEDVIEKTRRATGGQTIQGTDLAADDPWEMTERIQ